LQAEPSFASCCLETRKDASGRRGQVLATRPSVRRAARTGGKKQRGVQQRETGPGPLRQHRRRIRRSGARTLWQAVTAADHGAIGSGSPSCAAPRDRQSDRAGEGSASRPRTAEQVPVLTTPPYCDKSSSRIPISLRVRRERPGARLTGGRARRTRWSPRTITERRPGAPGQRQDPGTSSSKANGLPR